MMYLFEASTLVWLKLSKNPKPPSFFGVQTLPQLSHTILVFSLVCPHQNFWTMLVISSHKVFGNLKTLIVYVGIACATALIRNSFPAYESIFSFHHANLLSNLSFRFRKVLHLDLPTKDDNPKYVSCCLITLAPKWNFISS